MSQTPMEKCLEGIINIFHEYAKEEKPRDKLSKAELSKLLMEQFPNVLQDSMTPKATDDMFKELDQNKDHQLSFDEFVTLVSKILRGAHPRFHQDH